MCQDKKDFSNTGIEKLLAKPRKKDLKKGLLDYHIQAVHNYVGPRVQEKTSGKRGGRGNKSI